MGAHDQGADRGGGRWMTIPRTLCFLTSDDDVLLMKRAENRRVFPGRYNGIGGHLERDEDPFTGALREIAEETGLTVTNLRLRGISIIDAGQEVGILLFVFTAVAASRNVHPSEEGTLHWIPLDKAELLPLVEDLPILLTRLFTEQHPEPFFAHVSYDSADQIVMRFAGD